MVRPFYALMLIFFINVASATGMLETPVPNSKETGIGVISGWHCTAEVIEIQIDDQPRMTAGSRTPRGDTVEVCGRYDTGFSLLYNYNLLDPAKPHKVIAFADGVEFSRVDAFYTTNLGSEYLVGQKALYHLRNFPTLGQGVTVIWQEEKQNFSIINVERVLNVSGTYYGAMLTQPWGGAASIKQGKFTVRIVENRFELNAQYNDGTACSFSGPLLKADGTNSLRTDGLVESRGGPGSTASCDFFGGFYVGANGEVLTGLWTDNVRRQEIKAARLD